MSVPALIPVIVPSDRFGGIPPCFASIVSVAGVASVPAWTKPPRTMAVAVGCTFALDVSLLSESRNPTLTLFANASASGCDSDVTVMLPEVVMLPPPSCAFTVGLVVAVTEESLTAPSAPSVVSTFAAV